MPLPKISIIFLQAVIAVHFVLTVWANQCPWLPQSYQFCNFLVLGVGIGTVIATSNHVVSEMFLFGMAFALLQDIIVIATFYENDKTPRGCKEKSHFNFSFAMAIINLILKPVSCVLIFMNYVGRGSGGLKEKVATFRANQGSTTEPRNEPLPPQQAPPPY